MLSINKFASHSFHINGVQLSIAEVKIKRIIDIKSNISDMPTFQFFFFIFVGNKLFFNQCYFQVSVKC